MPGEQDNKAAGKSPRRRNKGEQTRRRILDAVLNVIAREGTRGVTHRAVAKEAGVQLSLTTYYFKDIGDMLREAFAQFTEHSRPGNELLWQEVNERLDRYSATELRRKAVCEALAQELASLATDYLALWIAEKPVGLAVEQVFFTQARLSPELRSMGQAHRQQLLKPLVKFCHRFNRQDPEVDAELLLDTITALEYQAIAMPPEQINRDFIERLVRRHLGWIMGLKRA